MQNNLTTLKKNTVFLLVLYGIFACSGLARILMQKELNMLYLPELIMIPFFYLLKDEIKHFVIDKYSMFYALLVWCILLIIGIVYPNQGTLFTSARGFLHLFFFYVVFRDKHNVIKSDVLMYVCLGSLIGWVLCVFYNFAHPEVYFEARGAGYTYGNMMVIPFFLYTSLGKSKNVLFFLGLIIIVFLLFTSGLRRMMIVTLLSLVLIIFSNKSSTKSLISTYAGIIIIALITFINIEQIGKSLDNTSSATYYRVFDRVVDTFEDRDMDSERAGNFTEFINIQSDYILPRGFMKTYRGGNFGKYNDLPLLILLHVFGAPLMYIIIVNFIIKWIKCFVKLLRRRSEYKQCFLISQLVVFLLLFLEGGFLTDPAVTQFTALSLGSITRISKQNIL